MTAIEGGSRLFFGEAPCATCHDGEMLTNNQAMDVGTGRALQVPLRSAYHFVFPSCTRAAQRPRRTLQSRMRRKWSAGHTRQLSLVQHRDLVTHLKSI